MNKIKIREKSRFTKYQKDYLKSIDIIEGFNLKQKASVISLTTFLNLRELRVCDAMFNKYLELFINDFFSSINEFYFSESAFKGIIKYENNIPLLAREISNNANYSLHSLLSKDRIARNLKFSKIETIKIYTLFYNLRNKIIITKNEENNLLRNINNFGLNKLEKILEKDLKVDRYFLEDFLGIKIDPRKQILLT